MNENEWGILSACKSQPIQRQLTGAYSQTLAINDVTVNDNNENGYEMKNIAGSRTQRTDMRGSAYRLRRE